MSRAWQDIAYPWGPSLASFSELKTDADVLRTSILNILLTKPGERVMLPDFGSAIPDAVFEPNDATLVTRLIVAAQDAIERWDDRIEFLDLTAEGDDNLLNVKVFYKNRKDPKEEAIQVAEFELIPSAL